MKIYLKNTFLGLAIISLGALTTSCDKDDDGDNDFGTKCYECTDMSNNQSDVICEDNYQNFVNNYGISNASNFEGFIDDVDGLPNISCEVELL